MREWPELDEMIEFIEEKIERLNSLSPNVEEDEFMYRAVIEELARLQGLID